MIKLTIPAGASTTDAKVEGLPCDGQFIKELTIKLEPGLLPKVTGIYYVERGTLLEEIPFVLADVELMVQGSDERA